MPYVDGYLLKVPKDKLDVYREMAQKAGAVWKKHGALQYFECVGEDLESKMKEAKLLKFPQLVDAGSDDVVIFSFIIFESRQQRDEINEKVMSDPFLDDFKDKPMPFEMDKMAYGGFETIVNF